jgi:streptogramin lyase
MKCPRGITIDKKGQVLTSEFTKNKIHVINSEYNEQKMFPFSDVHKEASPVTSVIVWSTVPDKSMNCKPFSRQFTTSLSLL